MPEKNRVKLYYTALMYLGIDASPTDKAPDEYGCAESVSTILKEAFPGLIEGSVSTAELYRQLKASPGFTRVLDIKFGDIIISPTGMGDGRIPNGHVGIMAEDERIMSNSSASGLWEMNYTLTSWVDRYRKKGGYPIYIFRKL